MKSLVASWGLAVGLVVPAVVALAVVEILNVAPGFASPRLVRARRALLAAGVVLVLIIGVVIVARFVYLRR